jgi:hypothetical protein
VAVEVGDGLVESGTETADVRDRRFFNGGGSAEAAMDDCRGVALI